MSQLRQALGTLEKIADELVERGHARVPGGPDDDEGTLPLPTERPIGGHESADTDVDTDADTDADTTIVPQGVSRTALQAAVDEVC